jgi:isopentenyl-diphosphate Delta-isomerase
MSAPVEPGRTVTLVDECGVTTGELDVVSAHTAPGYAHLACSAVVFGPGDTVLMQRRADSKPTFGGQWSNTCCTHPYAEEDGQVAAERRLFEELGIAVALRPAGTFRYRAEDTLTGMVEHELDSVYIAKVDTLLDTVPDAHEVAETRWMPLQEVLDRVALRHVGETTPTTPTTPWCDMVLRLALSARDA